MNSSKYVMTVVSDPHEIARARDANERFEKNWEWLEANAGTVYSQRGKFICIAGQELFVGDSVDDVIERAKAKHPNDTGRFTRFIPIERGPRIYAN